MLIIYCHFYFVEYSDNDENYFYVLYQVDINTYTIFAIVKTKNLLNIGTYY